MFRLASSLCFATRAALTAAAAPAVVPASAELLAVLPRRMAGHSQFANRKHIKGEPYLTVRHILSHLRLTHTPAPPGANDLKRAQLFTRLAR